jgi:transposase
MMGLTQKLITKEVYQKAVTELEHMAKDNRVAIRLRAIVSAKEHGISIVAKVFNITTNTLRSWVKRFKEGDFNNLEYKNGRGRKSNIKNEHYNALQEWIEKDSSLTINKILKRLEGEFNLRTSKSAVHRAMEKLPFSYITPRPKHYKQDQSQQEEFKKNLRKVIESNVTKSLYFFDESRFGTHSKLGYGWFKKGSRTSLPIKLGFENFYVYSAINPSTGDDLSLVAPGVNTACMNIFLAEMSQHLEGTDAIIVMDCAGWHKAKNLVVPDNIKIIYLPAYSPELNPVERLWQYLKSNTIKNKVYATVKDLEEAVCAFIRHLTQDRIKSICSASYLLT